MLKIISKRYAQKAVSFELTFDDEHGNGYAFPCDAQGNVSPDMPEEAKESMAYCLAHPEDFVRSGEVVRNERVDMIPARGICPCGEEIELYDQYRGACQCPKCGHWYNIYGQSLVNPRYWEEDENE